MKITPLDCSLNVHVEVLSQTFDLGEVVVQLVEHLLLGGYLLPGLGRVYCKAMVAWDGWVQKNCLRAGVFVNNKGHRTDKDVQLRAEELVDTYQVLVLRYSAKGLEGTVQRSEELRDLLLVGFWRQSIGIWAEAYWTIDSRWVICLRRMRAPQFLEWLHWLYLLAPNLLLVKLVDLVQGISVKGKICAVQIVHGLISRWRRQNVHRQLCWPADWLIT